MNENEQDGIIIVEGLTDKKQLEDIITDHMIIICTNGTLGIEKFDELLSMYDLDFREVYILVDEDSAGIKLRKQLRHELPHAEHIYISGEYREVATTPKQELAVALVQKHINVNPIFLKNNPP